MENEGVEAEAAFAEPGDAAAKRRVGGETRRGGAGQQPGRRVFQPGGAVAQAAQQAGAGGAMGVDRGVEAGVAHVGMADNGADPGAGGGQQVRHAGGKAGLAGRAQVRRAVRVPAGTGFDIDHLRDPVPGGVAAQLVGQVAAGPQRPAGGRIGEIAGVPEVDMGVDQVLPGVERRLGRARPPVGPRAHRADPAAAFVRCHPAPCRRPARRDAGVRGRLGADCCYR